ncbi:kinase-like domain-containing protein, partial [Gautieria morchelliformis]
VEDSEVEAILIPQNWQRYINTGKKEGVYLGYSFVKFAFTGHIGGKEYAIFQDKDIGGITESTNQRDLCNELHLLAWGQYFLDSFFERARKYGAKNIPGLCLVEPLAEVPAHERSKQSLLFSMFLATPLLPFPVGPGGMEQKFSGNSEVGENTDHVGIWVDAYTHHTLVDSEGEYLFVDIQEGFKYSDKCLILFDPQAHTYDYSSGFWDKGPPAIVAFLKEHKCNKVCRQLGLHREIVPRKQVDGSTTSADAMRGKKGNNSELDPLSKPDTVRSGKYLTLKELVD